MSVSISVVVPVYNSEKTLEKLYDDMSEVLKDLCGEDYEMVFVDDQSRDNSFTIMKEIHERDDRVKIIQLARNFGQQNALMCGFHYSKGDYVVTMDDDLQHPPEEVKKLIEKIKEGYDVVFGIPIEKKHALYRNMGSRMIGQLFNRICRKPTQVRVSSFRVMRRRIVTEIIKDKTSFVYIAPMIFRITDHVENVFVRHNERKYGRSNYNLIKLVKLSVKLVLYYSNISKFIVLPSQPQFEIRNMEVKEGVKI